LSGWSCKFEANGICLRVDGAYCRPGMKGCVLQGQVTFHDGIEPSPQWPKGHRRHKAAGEGGATGSQAQDQGSED
jgi:hypothetical protein